MGQDTDEKLGERIQKLEQENKDLLDVIESLKNRLDQLEDKEKPSAKKEEKEPKKKDAQEESKQVTTKESNNNTVEKETVEPWLPSLKGETFSLGGRLQAEYFKRESDNRFQSAIQNNDGGTFHIDEVRLYLDADFKNKISFHSAVDFQDNGSGLVEAYFEAEDLPLNSSIMLGMQPRFFRPSRYTESFPLTGIAFWRSRDLGVTVTSTYEPVTAYFSVLNGVELDPQEIGEDKSAYIIGDNDSGIDLNGNKEISAGIGLEHDFNEFGKVEVIGFGVVGELSNDDVFFLQTNIPGYGFSNDDTKYFTGVNLDYSIDEWDLFAQYITGEDGNIERSSWYTELSYKFTIDGFRYLNSIRPLVRYGVLDISKSPQPFVRNGSLLWDRRQWLFGVVSEIVDHVNFRFEYMLNEEDTGGPSVNNDEFLFQMEIEF
jgi:hypothetical protein